VLVVLAEEALCELLHRDQDHSADLLRTEGLLLALGVHLNASLLLTLTSLKETRFDDLHSLVVTRRAEQTLDVKGCGLRVDRSLLVDTSAA
jgi:hypothetical protein